MAGGKRGPETRVSSFPKTIPFLSFFFLHSFSRLAARARLREGLPRRGARAARTRRPPQEQHTAHTARSAALHVRIRALPALIYARAAAPHDAGFQTVILPGSPGYALYPSAHVAFGNKTSLPGMLLFPRPKDVFCNRATSLSCFHRLVLKPSRVVPSLLARFLNEVRSRSKPKPCQILAPCGKPCRDRRGNKRPCVFSRSRLRFALNAGSKVGAVQA